MLSGLCSCALRICRITCFLILLYNTSPSNPHDFYDRESAFKDKLLDPQHESGLDSDHYDEALAFVLTDHYELVGKPIVDTLRRLRVPERSRIWWCPWWCPTSTFCSLPLHAMGPIPSDNGWMITFRDLWIDLPCFLSRPISSSSNCGWRETSHPRFRHRSDRSHLRRQKPRHPSRTSMASIPTDLFISHVVAHCLTLLKIVHSHLPIADSHFPLLVTQPR